MKHLLYAYRVLLSGIHLMRIGEVVANIGVLNEIFRSPPIDELVARKRSGAEKMLLEESELEQHSTLLDALERELDRAHDQSRLPEAPTTIVALDALVVRARLSAA
ncbi:MAG TPA: nucleotidyltransferase domain-containing protein [Polyangiaceae bacterium]|nr:nucleotidyltransferase domain-containing protein [Polyangiaceae bacterium]